MANSVSIVMAATTLLGVVVWGEVALGEGQLRRSTGYIGARGVVSSPMEFTAIPGELRFE